MACDMERSTAKLCCTHRPALSQDVLSGRATQTKQVSMGRSDIRPRAASVRLLRDQSTGTLPWSGFWSGLSLIWSRVESRPAFVFVLLSFVFGSAISVVVPPLRGPDEIAHFLRIYSYTRGGLVPAAEVDGRKGIFVEHELYTQLSFFKNAGERFARNREQGLRYGEIMKEYPQPGGTGTLVSAVNSRASYLCNRRKSAGVMILPSTTRGEWRADTELLDRRDARA